MAKLLVHASESQSAFLHTCFAKPVEQKEVRRSRRLPDLSNDSDIRRRAVCAFSAQALGSDGVEHHLGRCHLGVLIFSVWDAFMLCDRDTDLKAHSSTPTPVFLTSRKETQTMVRAKLGPNSDHPRLCIYQGKEKLRPLFEFLGRENSDHALSLGCFGGRGGRGGS